MIGQTATMSDGHEGEGSGNFKGSQRLASKLVCLRYRWMLCGRGNNVTVYVKTYNVQQEVEYTEKRGDYFAFRRILSGHLKHSQIDT